LKEYGDPLIARKKFDDIMKASSLKGMNKIASGPSNLPWVLSKVEDILAKNQKKYSSDEFDIGEVLSFFEALEDHPELHKDFSDLVSGRSSDKALLLADKMKESGFQIPEGMERVGENRGNFICYIASKYFSVYDLVKDITEEARVDCISVLHSLRDGLVTIAVDKTLDNWKTGKVGFRRI
jgi:hypothetical protein